MQERVISTKLMLVYFSLAGFLPGLFGCSNPSDEPKPDDRATAIPVVEAYIQALSTRDEDAIMDLIIPANQKDRSGVIQRIEEHGGVDPKQAKITILEGITPWVPIARIEVQRDDQPAMTWTENLYWVDDEWLLRLSAREGDGPTPPVSGPEYTGPDPTSGTAE